MLKGFGKNGRGFDEVSLLSHVPSPRSVGGIEMQVCILLLACRGRKQEQEAWVELYGAAIPCRFAEQQNIIYRTQKRTNQTWRSRRSLNRAILTN